MSLGSIPLIIRPEKEHDYIQGFKIRHHRIIAILILMVTGIWRDYPGPVFDNWRDVFTFMETISIE
jgi:hypothetical protein